MRLYRVILPVSDIALAADFYRGLLQSPGERVSPGRHYFDCDGVILACFDPMADGDGFAAEPNQGHLYFSTPEIDTVWERARQLPFRRLDDEIETQPWGERCFYGTDPFGNQLCIVDQSTLFTGGVFFDLGSRPTGQTEPDSTVS